MTTEPVNHDELIAAAEAVLPGLIEAGKAADTAAKDAAKNSKQAADYLKGLGDEDDKTEAQTSAEQWAAEAARTKDELAAAKEDVKAVRQAIKDAKAAKREAGKAEREAAKAAKEAEKASRVRQNDVLMPKPDSKCGRAWAIFDTISAAEGRPAMLAEAVAAAEAENDAIEKGGEGVPHSVGNIRAEYSQWRKFHGVPAQGRPKKEPAAPAEEAATETAEA